MIKISDNWMGSEQSLLYVLDAMAQYREHPELFPPRTAFVSPKLAGTRLDDGEDPEDEDEYESPLIQVEGQIGILNINGPLTAQESWLDEYYGLCSYPAIARGIIELTDLYQEGEIDQIIHVWSTPGGDANGINGLTEVMQAALSIAPNTISYTGSQALSAGYWLATTNPYFYTDKMGEVGSVGVISTIKSISRMLEEDGIDVKVVRSGKYKALLHPYEPISAAGIKEVEEKSAQLHQFFIDHIRTSRPRISSQVSAWGEGQTFFGEDALKLGLIDGPVMTLNALVNQIKSLQNSERKQIFDMSATPDTHRGPAMRKKVLFPTPEAQAAVAAGADLNSVPHTVIDEEEDDAPETPETQTEMAAAPAAQEPEAHQTDLLDYLHRELSATKDEVDRLKIDLALLGREKEQLANIGDILSPIAIEAIQRMQVALRQSPAKLTGMSATVLAEQYAETKKEFERVMPVGVRAQSGHDDSREPLDVGEQRLFLVK